MSGGDLKARAVTWAYANGIIGDAFPDDPIVEHEEAWLQTSYAKLVMLSFSVHDFADAVKNALTPAMCSASIALRAFGTGSRRDDPRAVLWREWVRFWQRWPS